MCRRKCRQRRGENAKLDRVARRSNVSTRTGDHCGAVPCGEPAEAEHLGAAMVAALPGTIWAPAARYCVAALGP
jgi:hypothetical protein